MTEHVVQRPRSAIHILQENTAVKLVLGIFYPFFLGTKPELEATQSFIVQRRAAHVQVRETIVEVVLYRLPHEQIVRSQMLKFQFGRAEFIKRVTAFVKKNSGGNRPVFSAGNNYNTFPGRDHMALQILEKAKRLRRNTMTPPGLTVQRIVNPDRVGAVAELNRDSMLLGSANGATNPGIHPAEEPLLTVFQENDMTEERERRNRVRAHLLSCSAAFEVAPVSFTAMLRRKFIQRMQVFTVARQRRTKIRKWKRNATAPRQRTCYFHHGQ